MGRPFDIEDLKAALKDHRQWIGLGIIQKMALLDDRSALRVQLKVLPEERPAVATMTWEAVGPDAGSFTFPQPDDLVLVAFADGDPDQAYVIKRLTSLVDKIPLRAKDGHVVIQALSGKEMDLTSDTRINISRPGADGAIEPVVLGNVLIEGLTDLLTQFEQMIDDLVDGPIAISSSPGQPAPTNPTLVTKLNAIKANLGDLKSTYLETESTNIVSQLVFTERGGDA